MRKKSFSQQGLSPHSNGRAGRFKGNRRRDLAYKHEVPVIDRKSGEEKLPLPSLFFRVLLCPIALPVLFAYAAVSPEKSMEDNPEDLIANSLKSSRSRRNLEINDIDDDSESGDMQSNFKAAWDSLCKRAYDLWTYRERVLNEQIRLEEEKAVKAVYESLTQRRLHTDSRKLVDQLEEGFAMDICRTDRIVLPYKGFYMDGLYYSIAELEAMGVNIDEIDDASNDGSVQRSFPLSRLNSINTPPAGSFHKPYQVSEGATDERELEIYALSTVSSISDSGLPLNPSEGHTLVDQVKRKLSVVSEQLENVELNNLFIPKDEVRDMDVILDNNLDCDPNVDSSDEIEIPSPTRPISAIVEKHPKRKKITPKPKDPKTIDQTLSCENTTSPKEHFGSPQMKPLHGSSLATPSKGPKLSEVYVDADAFAGDYSLTNQGDSPYLKKISLVSIKAGR